MADPKSTNFYKGVYYFTRAEAEREAAEVGGTIEKTSRGYRVKDTSGNYLGPETKADLADASVELRFDSEAEAAVKAAEKLAAKAIVEITNETEANIRNLIATAIRDGIPPYDAARLIQPLIGLTSAQGQAVLKYRAELIDNGLTLEKVNEKVDDYADQLLSARGEAIARTEIMDALNTGQDEAWAQAQEAGLLSRGATKEVILTDDACPECVAIAEKGPVPIDEDFAEDGPPFHPHCRCTIAIATP